MILFGFLPLDLAAAWTAIAWLAGLAIAPAFLAAAPFLVGSLRRREAWWLMSPRRSERRVDPRCGRRAWTRLAVYAVPILAPGLVLGVALAWTLVGVLVAAAALGSYAVVATVATDSPRLARLASLPLFHAATLATAVVYAVAAGAVAGVLTPELGMWALYATPWLLAQLVLGWQVLVARRAQDGARRIARAAFTDNAELRLV